MKRAVCLLLLVALCLLLLSSCFTPSYYYDDSETIEFKTYCYATKIAEETMISGSFSLSKANGILVFIPSAFQNEYVLEKALQKEFEKNGIHCEVVSDYYNFDSIKSDEEVNAIIKEVISDENRERWGYDVEIFGEISSCTAYTTGDGVATLEINYLVYYDHEIVATISVSCESVRNTFKGFRETMEVASKEMSKKAVAQYLTYLK